MSYLKILRSRVEEEVKTGKEKGRQARSLKKGRGEDRRGEKKKKIIRQILKQLLKDNLPLESGIIEGLCN